MILQHRLYVKHFLQKNTASKPLVGKVYWLYENISTSYYYNMSCILRNILTDDMICLKDYYTYLSEKKSRQFVKI